jgi:hypothetical protein
MNYILNCMLLESQGGISLLLGLEVCKLITQLRKGWRKVSKVFNVPALITQQACLTG